VKPCLIVKTSSIDPIRPFSTTAFGMGKNAVVETGLEIKLLPINSCYTLTHFGQFVNPAGVDPTAVYISLSFIFRSRNSLTNEVFPSSTRSVSEIDVSAFRWLEWEASPLSNKLPLEDDSETNRTRRGFEFALLFRCGFFNRLMLLLLSFGELTNDLMFNKLPGKTLSLKLWSVRYCSELKVYFALFVWK